MLYIDLDELGALDRLWPLSVNRPNIFSFFESDHLKQDKGQTDSRPLSLKIRELARQGGIDHPVQSITLLTLPRIFNYVFNPVSFYFLFGGNKEPLACVVEVSNTFNEMKTYLIKAPTATTATTATTADHANDGQVFNLTAPKHFYVSPFGELADSFQFVVPVPDKRLAVVINTVRISGADNLSRQPLKIMAANLSGQACPLTSGALILNLVRYPLLTFKIMAMIHWHALLLFFKKVPFHAKDEASDLQTGVFNRRKEKANG